MSVARSHPGFTSLRRLVASASLGACLLGASSSAAQFTPIKIGPKEKERRMTADAVKLKGLELKKLVDADVDGDGRKETFGIASGEKGLQLVVIGENAEGAVVTDVLPPVGGKELAKLEALQLAPPKESFEIVVEAYDETPDDKVKRVRIYGLRNGKLGEIFTSVIHRPKDASQRDEWERDKSIVSYGDARGGWYFSDDDEDGSSEIYVRRKPQILRIPKDSGDDVKIMTGVREQVWAWDDGAAAFKERTGGDRLKDFLPALELESVTSSSTYIAPAELQELESQALADALNKGSDKPAEIDRSKWTSAAIDKDLSTSWIEGNDKSDGTGEWLEVKLADEAPVHMVRVVSGCVGTQADYKSHNVPENFTIRLDNGSDLEVKRRSPGSFDTGIVAFSDKIVRLPDRPWAVTTLVFLDGKRPAQRVRITMSKMIKQGKGNLGCISEVSVH